MYNQIAANKRKTALLMSLFLALIFLLGWIIGGYFEEPQVGIVVAAGFAVLMTSWSYFGGDKVALAVSHAKPIAKGDHPSLYRMVENLCIAAGIKTLPKIFIIPDTTINAFATGRNPKHASLAVTEGALRKLENEELEGVLAHELSHIKNYDIRVMTVVVLLVGFVALLADLMLRVHLFGGRDRDRGGSVYLAILGIVLAILSPFIAEFIKLAVSRKREYLADASGALITRFPEGLARALEKIAAEGKPMHAPNHATAHLYIANPFGRATTWFARLWSTHPPLADRIALLRKIGI